MNGQFEEQTDQAVTYHYDTNPFATTSNAWGRLAAVTFSNGFRYDYSYNQAGRVTSRNLHARTAYVRSEPYCCATEERFFDFPMAYQWDNEGRMTSVQYPAAAGGATYNYGFDDMGRLSSMTQGGNSVATATYGVAGELTTLWTANFGTETHTYNSMFQLTRIRAVDQSGPGVDLEYRYAAGQNNGRITQSVDWASGEEVTYTYDALQRLTKAETTGPQWGQAYSYDGFGNLTGKTVTKGSATTLSLAIDAATNRPAGVNYDANGNAPIGTWDVENRLVVRAADGVPITYDPSNQRVMQYKIEPNALGNYPTWTISLYGLGGERAGDVKCVRYDINNYLCNGTAEPTFGGRRLAVVDRLGSTRATSNGLTWTHSSYYPYGEEKDPGGAEGTVRFGTYVRDSMGAGVDYANQRYYSPLMGRFFSPDPSKGVSIEDPVAWNRYAYVLSDPINYTDSSGLDADPVYPSDAVFRISSTASMDRSWAGQVSEFFIRYMQGTLDSEPLRDQNLFLAQAVGGARNRRVPWYQEHPCDRRDETNNRILSFMEANQADAKTIAAAAGIDYTFVLGIAAEETLYGTKGIVLNSNNFFGLHVNDANDAHHFANQVGVYIATNDGPVARFAPATGFLDSGLGFATVARAHVSGISNPGALARTLHQHGYGVTNPNYETELGSAINNIQRRVDCLK